MKLFLEQMNHYTNMMEKLLKLCQQCLIAAQEEDSIKLARLIDNRERLLQIIKEFNFDINGQVHAQYPNLEQKDQKLVLRQVNFIQSVIEQVSDIDEFLIESIEQMKDHLKMEIGHSFETAKKFKGYNLQNLKR